MFVGTMARGAFAGVVLGAACASASAESLRVVDASVLFKEADGRVYFSVELNRVPNWPMPLVDVLPSPDGLATLSDGAVVPTAGVAGALPVESFQIFLDVAPEDEPADAFPWEVVVRGGEATEGSGIPLRDAEIPPVDTDPVAGGWGPVLGIADYTLEGSTISFSAPNAWVGISEAGVSYELIVLSDGAIVDTFVPTPTALAAGLMLLGGGLLRRKVRERAAG